MAFLCPARRRKAKKTNGGQGDLAAPFLGRITGSSSIDTLVRVGLEKEKGPRARMVVIHDFTPCVDDELEVHRGQQVHVLYQENDWLYVMTDDGQEGFVPYTYCLPLERSVDDFALPKPNDRAAKKESASTPLSKPGSSLLNKSSSRSMPDITTELQNSHPVVEQSNIKGRGDARHKSNYLYGKENRQNSTGHKTISGVENLAFMNRNPSSSKDNMSAHKQRDKDDNPFKTRERSNGFKTRERSDSFKEATLKQPSQSNTNGSLPRSTTGSTRSLNTSHPGSQSFHKRSYSGFDTIRSSDMLARSGSREALLQPVIKPFTKTPQGKYIVLFSFNALEEGDLTVRRGEFVTLLNRDDPDWYWVARSDGIQGFVPTSFLCQAEGQTFEHRQDPFWNPRRQVSTSVQSQDVASSNKLTKLICVQDYHAKSPSDLTVKRGDCLYTSLGSQKDSTLIYVFSVSGDQSGYIPRVCAKPMMADITSRDPYVSP